MHVFAKVDVNGDQKIDTRVMPSFEQTLSMFLQEMKQACKYLCKVFGFEKSTVRKQILFDFQHSRIHKKYVCVQERELVKYMKEYDADGDGTLDFGEFQTAMRFAQHKKNNQIHKDEVDVWE